jgi:hypothetical protein
MVPLDLSNLPNPVPASVYFDARSDDCWAKHSHCSTITDDSYRPRLAIKARVWSSLMEGWSDCYHGSLVDPPIGLRPLTEAQQQPTITVKPHVPTKETGATFGQVMFSQPSEAKPGDWVGSKNGGLAQPTAAVRTGYTFHGKPGVFQEVSPTDKLTPNPSRLGDEGQEGHSPAPHTQPESQANNQDSDPQDPQLEAQGVQPGSRTQAAMGDGRSGGQY